MSKKKFWSETIELESLLPIDITLPKTYVLANVPFDENHWTRVFTSLGGAIIVTRVTQKKPLSRSVQLKIESSKALDNTDINLTIDKIRYEIGLDEKMQILKEIRDSDPLVGIAVRSNPGFRLFANTNIQEVVILTILSQNTSFFNYLSTTKAFFNKYGTKVAWDKSLKGFPNNETLANMTSKDWLELKLGYKSKFLSNLTLEDLENFETYANYPILKRGLDGLRKIKGVGHYTARCLMIYGSRRYEYAFLDSYVREVLQHKYDLGGITTIRDFDKWINERWPEDPALILHSLLLEYLPVYLQSYREEIL